MITSLQRLLAKWQRRDPVAWLVQRGLTVGRNFVMLEEVVPGILASKSDAKRGYDEHIQI